MDDRTRNQINSNLAWLASRKAEETRKMMGAPKQGFFEGLISAFLGLVTLFVLFLLFGVALLVAAVVFFS